MDNGMDEPRTQAASSKRLRQSLIKTLSHDIRSSLVTQSSIVKLMRRGRFGSVDRGVSEKLDELYSRMTRLIGVTEDYLALSLDGDLSVEKESVDLQKEVLEPVLEEFQPEMEEREVRLDSDRSDFPAESVKVRGNKILLKSIYRNLIKNAVRHGGKGRVLALGGEAQGSHYRLNVFNEGEPVPEEQRSHLFEEAPEEAEGEGMGVGLALVREIVEEHGGEIRYEAAENGSNFVFTLPGAE